MKALRDGACGAAALLAMAALVLGPPARAADLQVDITYLKKEEPPLLPLSLAEPVLTDEGVMGARQALEDNATTGRFLGHDYALAERIVPEDGDLVATFREALEAGERLFVADLHAEQIESIAPLADEAGALVFNTRAPDDALRTETCFASVLHTAPSLAMKADALAQYLLWKRWTRWVLMSGTLPADRAFADALRHSAEKFGAEILEEREYAYVEGSRRTDTGHVQIQRQMPVLTQDLPDHDVLIVADESEVFADYVPYMTWDARPVAGSAGLVPTAWSRVHEQWGGTQMQRRFEDFAKRPMTERDFNAWVAVRSIGEAVTRGQSTDPKAIHDYMLSDAFALAAFKGEGVTYRTWNQQLRQPILLVTARMLVSVSPQEQFLHQRTPLDTLGYDEPESDCRLNG